jgi:diguanylate cyclase (GGDEF)-like protein
MGQGKEAAVTISAAITVIFASTLLVPPWVMVLLAFVDVLGRPWRHMVVNGVLQLVPVASAVVVLQLVTTLGSGLPAPALTVIGGLIVCVVWWATAGAVMALLLAYVEGIPLRGTPVFGPEPNRVLWSQMVLGLVSATLIRESWWYLPFAVMLVLWAFRYFRLQERAVAADLDGKTGLVRYDVFRDACYREQQRSARSGAPISLVILDIDQFRTVNERHGHQVGDAVLGHVAATLSSRLKWLDVLARFGGDELVLMLPDVTAEEAAARAAELQAAVAGAPYDAPGGAVAVVLSAGLTDLRPHEPLDEALLRLEQALYEAKGTGPGRQATRLD